MRMMCLRLLRGVRSGYTSVDTMGALVTPLFTLCSPGVALWLKVGVRVRPFHDVLGFREANLGVREHVVHGSYTHALGQVGSSASEDGTSWRLQG